jgi:hypothetical protein
MKVRIDHAPGGKGGVISVSYAELEQLDRLCALLSGLPEER